MRNGDVIHFKTTGYEIAEIRNPDPPKQWTGVVMGNPGDTHVMLWCEREGREPAPVCVAIRNIISNDGPKLGNPVWESKEKNQP